MEEMEYREHQRRGDLYVKVGRRYRLIGLETDMSGALIDLGHNLYYKRHDDDYELVTGGPKGDIKLSSATESLPPVGEDGTVRSFCDEESTDRTVRKLKNAGKVAAVGAGCVLGPPAFLIVGCSVSLLFVFITQNPIAIVGAIILAIIFWPRGRKS